jgi:hypothetical protein
VPLVSALGGLLGVGSGGSLRYDYAWTPEVSVCNEYLWEPAVPNSIVYLTDSSDRQSWVTGIDFLDLHPGTSLRQLHPEGNRPICFVMSSASGRNEVKRCEYRVSADRRRSLLRADRGARVQRRNMGGGSARSGNALLSVD